MLTIEVHNLYCKITELEVGTNLYNLLDDELSFFVQGYEFSKGYRKGYWDKKLKKWAKWDGRRHLLDKRCRFHTGLLDRVKRLFDNNGIKYEVVDDRVQVPFGKPLKTKNIESRPYQDTIHEACVSNKGGIIKSATGSGKSIMITRLVAEMNVKTMIMVVGTDLLYQLHESLEKFLGRKIGIIGDGKAEIRNINICSVWTAATALGEKYENFDDEDKGKKEKFNTKNKAKIDKAIRAAECVVFDECQFLASKTLQAINNASDSAYYKFGFSATPARDDGADLLLEAVCGNMIADVSATELIDAGYLIRPTIHFMNVPAYDGQLSDNYQSIYKEYIVENEVRNEIIANAASKLIDKGRKVLILVKNIKHGDLLMEMLEDKYDVYFIKGALGSDERNEVRMQFLAGKIDLIIATTVYDQGVDLPNLDALILAGSGKSTGRALQRIGRVIRWNEGKTSAIVVDFLDSTAKYLSKHALRRVTVYRTEPGFRIKMPKGMGNGSKGKATIKKGNQEKKKGKHMQVRRPIGKVSW